MTDQFSEVDISRMRQILAQHDGQSRNTIQVMDPNNPPKELYRHQQFPMMVYDHAKSSPAHEEIRGVKVGNIVTEQKVFVDAVYHSKTVANEKELKSALAKGWSMEAPHWSEAEEELEALAS
jgi:hypothetical protein